MTSRKRKNHSLRALCAQFYPDDGVDPRTSTRHGADDRSKPDRKLRQLCQQVAHTLQLALGALPHAEMLAGVYVEKVVPGPHAGRLRAVVTVPDPQRRAEIAHTFAEHSRRLRSEVATAITRRRAPELVFEFVVEGGAHD